MHIWVDADACPRVVKEILFRAADRLSVPVTLVANKLLHTPSSPHITAIKVPGGFDVADAEIVKRMSIGDLVITADVPLAAQVVEGGGFVIDPRGRVMDEDSVQQQLSLRNFMEELRSAGVDTGGPPAISHKDREAFANQLDRFLRERLRS